MNLGMVYPEDFNEQSCCQGHSASILLVDQPGRQMAPAAKCSRSTAVR